MNKPLFPFNFWVLEFNLICVATNNNLVMQIFSVLPHRHTHTCTHRHLLCVNLCFTVNLLSWTWIKLICRWTPAFFLLLLKMTCWPVKVFFPPLHDVINCIKLSRRPYKKHQHLRGHPLQYIQTSPNICFNNMSFFPSAVCLWHNYPEETVGAKTPQSFRSPVEAWLQGNQAQWTLRSSLSLVDYLWFWFLFLHPAPPPIPPSSIPTPTLFPGLRVTLCGSWRVGRFPCLVGKWNAKAPAVFTPKLSFN